MWQLTDSSKVTASPYGEWLLSGNCPLTPAGNIRRPSEALPGQWIKTAWDDILPESIIKGFKKCCVSNDTNQTQDNACARKTVNKTLLLVIKVLTVIR
jgi:hypothetical protein